MSTQIPFLTITLPAAADLSTKQFYGMKVDSAGRAAVAAAGELCVGVLQNKPDAIDKEATISVLGASKMVAAGSITAGAQVAVDANGKATTATKAAVNTSDGGVAADAVIASNVIGIALTGASANDVFPVLLLHAGAVPTTAA
ncbi:hypothetical protein UFOVP1040_86 [uncultured Caudovirales phage]|uniref:Uncharacterized protein n=1 Tax=uncultured Caudovirales phage TaxID=2100421 RepID=A0A6J5QE44_9CAUD|nr:hypothetical protein UFOVP1040_86 [uncultured Caudovirales phage]